MIFHTLLVLDTKLLTLQELLSIVDKVRRGLDSPEGSLERAEIISKIEQASSIVCCSKYASHCGTVAAGTIEPGCCPAGIAVDKRYVESTLDYIRKYSWISPRRGIATRFLETNIAGMFSLFEYFLGL